MTQTKEIQIETVSSKRIEAFAEQVFGYINGGMLTLMISLGHRTGLFDAMAELPPSTSEGIAKASGLNERYVREWLGAMTTGRIVDYDPTARTYSLPPEHAQVLTRAFPAQNLAVATQHLGQLGAVELMVADCFRNGGGVPYTEFKRFHQIMAEDSDQTVVAVLVDHIVPLTPGLVRRLEAGIDVLDLGCGRGRALLTLAQAYPKSRFTGFDLSEEAIAWAKEKATERALENVTFFVEDAGRYEAASAFDHVFTFDAIHDQTDPAGVLRRIYQALRPGGTYCMQDIKMCSHVGDNLDSPIGPFVYTISCMHCMTVSLAQGGQGLGAAWGKELALEMLADAGFKDVDVRELEHDLQNYYYIMSKPA